MSLPLPEASGASWAPGGPKAATKAAPKTQLAGSWGSPGGSWGRLGALLVPLWRRLGPAGGSPMLEFLESSSPA